MHRTAYSFSLALVLSMIMLAASQVAMAQDVRKLERLACGQRDVTLIKPKLAQAGEVGRVAVGEDVLL